MQGQSRKMSALEIVVNYIIGFCLALCVQIFLMNLIGLKFNVTRDFSFTIIFTLVSVIRAYTIRRIFNHIHIRSNKC